MKSISVIVVLLLGSILFCVGCRKANTDTNYSQAIAKSRTWSGNHSSWHYLFPNDTVNNYNHPINNIVFAVNRIDANTLTVPGYSYVMKFRSIDEINHIIRFDTVHPWWDSAILNFYYATDSVDFKFAGSAFGFGGMEDPVYPSTHLYSHK